MNSLNTNSLLLPNRAKGKKEIQFSEILYLEGSENYTYFHLNSGKVILSSRTLLFHIENSVNEQFIRIHKSICVNKLFVASIDTHTKEFVLLHNGKELAVARRRRNVLKGLKF